MTKRDILQAVGVRAVAMIEANVRNGIGYDGKRFAYSTRPFAMPAAGLRSMRGYKGFVKEGRLKTFTTKQGRLWAVVTGGYRDLREMRGQRADGDWLQSKGDMMRNLNVISVTDDNVRIGFDDPVQQQKALWLSVVGVGPSRRLWRFMGLRPEQETRLAEYAAGLVAKAGLEAILQSDIFK